MWESGEATWIADVGDDENLTRAPHARAASLTQGFAAPVLADGELVAVIEFFAHEEHAEDSRLLEIVSAVAAQLGSVIVRKETEEALRETEARFRSIAESATEAILLADEDGDILFWNSGATAMFGYAAEEVLGKPVAMLMPESDRDAHRAALEREQARGEAGPHGRALGPAQGRHRLPARALDRELGERARALLRRDHPRRHRAPRRARGAAAPRAAARARAGDRPHRQLGVGRRDQLGVLVGRDVPDLRTRSGKLGAQLRRVPPARAPRRPGEDRAHRRRVAGEPHEPFGYEHRLVWPDGSVRVVLAHGEVIVEDGRAVRMIGTGQDITERKANEDALARSNTDLANFAYVASHDLSEPLRIVSGYVELLASRYRGQLDEQADQFIDYTLNAVARMQKLISDLLAYSSVGSVPIASGLVDMNARRPRRARQPRAHGRGARRGGRGRRAAGRARRRGPARAPDPEPDLERREVLLAGARRGSACRAQRAEGSWRFTVTDNGIGIPPEDRRRIFQMFERGRARDGYPGTGMGLAICKRIVEQHGGEIWVEESVSGGSAFHFTLPDAGVRTAAPAG